MLALCRHILVLALMFVAGAAHAAAEACPALLDHRFPRLQDDAPQSLCQYKGKVVLVVNTASFCGFTSQGLVVVGFPSNDFGSQEPGSNKEIADFCRLTYGVKFPMFAKTDVTGASTNPLYRQLASLTGERPKWNFHKYLIDRSGQKVLSFPSTTSPDSRSLVNAVEKALADRL